MRARLLRLARRLRWPLRVLGVIGGLWVLAAISWFIAVRAAEFPHHLLDKASATSLAVVDANGIVLRQEATSAGLRESWISIDQISPHLINATLASEDHDFYGHAGVDWSALVRAAWLNVRGGEVEFGGSTITMQLVRLTVKPSRSFAGKVRQLILAARLERSLSKREILEHYFNRVYYGNGAWGAEQAARGYPVAVIVRAVCHGCDMATDLYCKWLQSEPQAAQARSSAGRALMRAM